MRAFKALNFRQYNAYNFPKRIAKDIELIPPKERQYVLRMIIRKPFGEFQIPEKYKWVFPLIKLADESQKSMDIHQPYCYLTIRHGEITSELDDIWHVDGFSKTITHLPEQNYAWSNKYPTEFIVKPIVVPTDFDSQKHNLHLFIQDTINNMNTESKISTFGDKQVMCFDPYVIHRRPFVEKEAQRTFVRVSFTPIVIADDSNTQNPLISSPKFNRKGLDFRNSLIKY